MTHRRVTIDTEKIFERVYFVRATITDQRGTIIGTATTDILDLAFGLGDNTIANAVRAARRGIRARDRASIPTPLEIPHPRLGPLLAAARDTPDP